MCKGAVEAAAQLARQGVFLGGEEEEEGRGDPYSSASAGVKLNSPGGIAVTPQWWQLNVSAVDDGAPQISVKPSGRDVAPAVTPAPGGFEANKRARWG